MLAMMKVGGLLVGRLGASYSAPLCGKEASCCGQMSL